MTIIANILYSLMSTHITMTIITITMHPVILFIVIVKLYQCLHVKLIGEMVEVIEHPASHPVLETGTLPIELRPFAGRRSHRAPRRALEIRARWRRG